MILAVFLSITSILTDSEVHRTARANVRAGDLPAAAGAWSTLLATVPRARTNQLAESCERDRIVKLLAGAGDAEPYFVLPGAKDGCYVLCYGLVGGDGTLPAPPKDVVASLAPAIPKAAEVAGLLGEGRVLTEADLARYAGRRPNGDASPAQAPEQEKVPKLPEGYAPPPEGASFEDQRRHWAGLRRQAHTHLKDEVEEDLLTLDGQIRTYREALANPSLPDERRAQIHSDLPSMEEQLKELQDELKRARQEYDAVMDASLAAVGENTSGKR